MDIHEILKKQKKEGERQRAWGDYGMVVSATEESSKIGADILKKGGNAMDALAAVQFGLAVSEPFNTGLASSGFIIYYDAEKKETKVIQGHSKAPHKSKKNVFVDEHEDVIPFLERSTPGTAVAIPGILKAFDKALELYGSKSWSELMEPAIRLSEEGVVVNKTWKSGLDRFGNRLSDEAKKFFFPNGVPLTEGEKVVNKELTKTLKRLQEKGADDFYCGEIAHAIVDITHKLDGCLTLEDLANYEAKVQEPLQANYKGFDVVVPSPPNGGGLALLYMLQLLEQLDLSQYEADSWERYYILTETLRIMTSDKLAYLADPDFYDVPVDGMLHPDYIKERLKIYNFEYRSEDILPGNPWEYDNDKSPSGLKPQKDDKGSETTHFIAADRHGNIAACTSSLEHTFGSGIMVPGYGFLLNNDMTDFDPDPAGVNGVEPNKYAVSAKTPTFVFKDGKPFLALGSPGGPTIVASVMQTLINVIDYQMDLKEAIEAPRVYNGTGPLIWWEEGIPSSAKQKMEKMNYDFDKIPLEIGNVQAILFDQVNGLMYGASDSSRPGKPACVNKDEAENE
ncbi:gamma-glutamyltranspeptidase/glutathione hydrolase [Bacillus ectoiniformans]|uniref:gamma-glutamyltransferase n=1 Tax=Bacillus ectoiniformans TaxID=1494429 RepID=UPI001958E748|nr:gamma-glutamyltransferase [Bacillus ectoiniformans]MBM7649253.1 gamma-glutamyltranspeptidase/glutathione hydrolase [Bacillus ectoiniformans]